MHFEFNILLHLVFSLVFKGSFVLLMYLLVHLVSLSHLLRALLHSYKLCSVLRVVICLVLFFYFINKDTTCPQTVVSFGTNYTSRFHHDVQSQKSMGNPAVPIKRMVILQ